MAYLCDHDLPAASCRECSGSAPRAREVVAAFEHMCGLDYEHDDTDAAFERLRDAIDELKKDCGIIPS